jgi:recombination protein RecT
MSTQAQAIEKTNGSNGKGPSQAIERVRGENPAGKPGTLKAFLGQQSSALAEAARGFMKSEDMIRYALIAATKNPLILKCTMTSILRSLMDASAVKVRPGGVNGRGYLVPRKVKIKEDGKADRYEWQCFFDPGYRGFIDIARRSGQIVTFAAEAVYEKDEFEFYYDPEPNIRHRPMLTGDRGEVVAAWAMAKFRDGSRQIEVVTKSDLEKIMGVSEAGKRGFGPWKDWYDQQARKTAARRLSKWLPTEDEEQRDTLERAMVFSNQADSASREIISPEEAPEVGHDPAEEVKAQLTAGNSLDDLNLNEAERELIESE